MTVKDGNLYMGNIQLKQGALIANTKNTLKGIKVYDNDWVNNFIKIMRLEI